MAEAVERARFWPRVLAIVIDLLAVTTVLASLGLLLFEPTGGRIRISDVWFSKTTCTPVDPASTGLTLPAGFRATDAQRCTSSLLGCVFDRSLTVNEVTHRDRTTLTRSIGSAIDADGHPVDAFYLDHIRIFVLAALLSLAEWRFGATLGKLLFRVRVRSLGGGPLTFVQAAKRTLMRLVPFYMLLLWPLAGSSFLLEHMTFTILVLLGTSVVLWVAFAVNFMRAVDRNDLPWHDRWARTEAIWTGPSTQSEQPG